MHSLDASVSKTGKRLLLLNVELFMVLQWLMVGQTDGSVVNGRTGFAIDSKNGGTGH